MVTTGTCSCSESAIKHVARGDEAQVDQNLAELVAALPLQFERAVQIFTGDQALLNQNLAKPHGR